MSVIPTSLYIHFPWCIRKCPYCDFNSHEVKQPLAEDQYIDALETDLVNDLATSDAIKIRSIFLGGGTPSLFSADSIKDLISRLGHLLEFDRDIEITLEANPGTADHEKFAGYYDAGINRLSIGVQSFDSKHLQQLGRIHTAKEAGRAVDLARRAGFTNINVDLMHGLPNQSVEGAIEDLKRAIDLNPTHISWYQLTIEPNTLFFNDPPQLPDDEITWEIYSRGLKALEQAGYHRYEVSAFCLEGKQSSHNLNYWLFGDYIGIGAGAHGKITRDGEIVRTSKSRSPADYLRTQKALRTPIDAADLALEFLMNTMRLTRGFERSLFSERTALPAEKLQPFLDKATSMGLITQEAQRIKPTKRGIQYLNELLMLVD